jgi:hypothetical protein
MAIDNETTIARSDRFTRTVSYQPFTVRASDFAYSIAAEPDSLRSVFQEIIRE